MRTIPAQCFVRSGRQRRQRTTAFGWPRVITTTAYFGCSIGATECKQADPRAFADARTGLARDTLRGVDASSCRAVFGGTDHTGDDATDVLPAAIRHADDRRAENSPSRPSLRGTRGKTSVAAIGDGRYHNRKLQARSPQNRHRANRCWIVVANGKFAGVLAIDSKSGRGSRPSICLAYSIIFRVAETYPARWK